MRMSVSSLAGKYAVFSNASQREVWNGSSGRILATSPNSFQILTEREKRGTRIANVKNRLSRCSWTF